MNEEQLAEQKKEEANKKLANFPLQYNQMAINGLMELNEINVNKFKEKLGELEESDYQIFIKYMDTKGHGAFILKRLTDSEFDY